MAYFMVTDITHLLDEEGFPVDGPAGRLARYLGTIISSASVAPVGVWIDAAIRCRRRPNRQPWRGHIRLRRTGLSSPVDWGCTWCDEGGVINNWQRSIWDLSVAGVESWAINGQPLEVVLAIEELNAVRQNLIFDLEIERVLASARKTAQGCLMRAPEEDLDNILEYIASEANHEGNRRRVRLLNQAYDQIELALRLQQGNRDKS